jgi:hypothetical protein
MRDARYENNTTVGYHIADYSEHSVSEIKLSLWYKNKQRETKASFRISHMQPDKKQYWFDSSLLNNNQRAWIEKGMCISQWQKKSQDLQSHKYIYLTPNRRLRAQTCDLSGCKTVCLHPKRKMKQVCIVFCVFMSQQGIIVHDNNYSQKKKNREIQIDLLNNDPPKRKCAPHWKRILFSALLIEEMHLT